MRSQSDDKWEIDSHDPHSMLNNTFCLFRSHAGNQLSDHTDPKWDRGWRTQPRRHWYHCTEWQGGTVLLIPSFNPIEERHFLYLRTKQWEYRRTDKSNQRRLAGKLVILQRKPASRTLWEDAKISHSQAQNQRVCTLQNTAVNCQSHELPTESAKVWRDFSKCLYVSYTSELFTFIHLTN